MIPLRLVVDTNVVVSAALKPDGLERTVILLAIAKPARLYVSNPILAEYRDMLSRPELQKFAKASGNSYCNSSEEDVPTLLLRSGACRSPAIPATTSF